MKNNGYMTILKKIDCSYTLDWRTVFDLGQEITIKDAVLMTIEAFTAQKGLNLTQVNTANVYSVTNPSSKYPLESDMSATAKP